MINNLKNFFKILAVFPQNTCIIVKERWWTGGIYLAGAGLIVPQQSTVKNGDSTECHSQPPPLYICAAATDEGDDDDSCYWLFMKRL